jgi:site-specific recombinase XerC
MVSFDGQLVDTSQIWRVRASLDGGKMIELDWAHQEKVLGSRAQYLLKLYFADRVTRKKARTIENDFRMFLRLQEWLRSRIQPPAEWTSLTEGLVRAFLQHGVERTADKGNDFSRLRTFYRWGVARQYRDFDPAFLDVLRSITAVGNAKGHSVRFRDVIRGPFSPDELLLIGRAVRENLGTSQDRAIVMLHLELGHNPNASARLRNSDLIRYETKSGVVWQLDVPRVKKRTPGRETKRRPISSALGSLLKSLEESGPEEPLLHWLPASSPEAAINQAMRRFAHAADLTSPRTQLRMRMNARRFRFSIATHMAEEGASLFHIAEVLDHSDTQNVRVYVETASSIADPVALATDDALAPLVRRFQGQIIESDEHLTAADHSDRRIPAAVPHLRIPLLDVGGIGLCGRDPDRDGLCQLFPPLSCYLCPSFAALRTGPHRQMLESIDKFLRDHEHHSDRRILLQLDQVRTAIRQVSEGTEAPGARIS